MPEIFDVVVVGGGGAGLTAAAEAARLGRTVVLLEKAARFGGTTRLSVGSLMGAGTRLQRAAGIADSPDQHEQELEQIVRAAALGDNPVLRRLLVDNLADTVDFLQDIGVDFIGPLPQPPFQVPRFYQALPGGGVYVRRLVAHCRSLRVVMRRSTPVESLLLEEGRVCGVRCGPGGNLASIRARCGVVLAAGDMSADRTALRGLWGPDFAALEPFNPGSRGDGQRLGLAAGGRLVLRPDLVPHSVARFVLPTRTSLFFRIPAWRPITRLMRMGMRWLPENWIRPWVLRAAMTALAPERSLYEAGAVLVNRKGDRFVVETGPIGTAVAAQPGAEAFVVFDGEIAERFSAWPHFISTAPGVAYAYLDDYRVARADLFFEAPTLEALAGQLNMEESRLSASVASRKTPVAGPFVALGPMRSWLLLTPAGLAVNRSLQVLSSHEAPIPGLYAAGGTGQGGLSFTHYYHGHSLGWAFTSGRLAGRAVAAETPRRI